MVQLHRIRRGSLVDTAIESLRSAIQDGQWPVGERLPVEAELAEALGVSRNTVREAVRVLAHVGMLETRQGDGTYVRSIRDPGESLRRVARSRLQDQLEVRIMLETEAASLAARRRTEEDLRRMTAALDDRARSGDDLTARVHHDERFHHALVEAAHNPPLLEMYRYFAQSVAETIERTETDAELPEPSQEDHELLLAAIRQQNADRATIQARALLEPSLGALKGREQ
ncbi:FadR/GntR family transcriptional regulator [Marinobacter lacisalsi]|uniref:FadR/GntR family transcriptional regulator n=1 Tax=Marinobacter lacisalsi TaxID=475979 RepID=A0ABV8QHE6_9GAMM